MPCRSSTTRTAAPSPPVRRPSSEHAAFPTSAASGTTSERSTWRSSSGGSPTPGRTSCSSRRTSRTPSPFVGNSSRRTFRCSRTSARRRATACRRSGRRWDADAVGVYASDKPSASTINPDGLRPAARALLLRANDAYSARWDEEMSPAALAGFSAAWALFADVLPAATSLEPADVAAAARAIEPAAGQLAERERPALRSARDGRCRRQHRRGQRDLGVGGAGRSRRHLATGVRHRCDGPERVGRLVRRRGAIVAGVAAVAAYAGLAALSGHLSPLARGPLLDGHRTPAAVPMGQPAARPRGGQPGAVRGRVPRAARSRRLRGAGVRHVRRPGHGRGARGRVQETARPDRGDPHGRAGRPIHAVISRGTTSLPSATRTGSVLRTPRPAIRRRWRFRST